MIHCRVYTCNEEAVYHLTVRVDGKMEDCGDWCLTHAEGAISHLHTDQYKVELVIA